MEGNIQDEDGGRSAKRIKLSVDDQLIEVGPGLLDLSDDVMLMILAFLSPADLINLSQSCARLWNVTRDRTLWSHVDCRENPLDSDAFETTYVEYLLPSTRYLAVDFRTRAHRKKGRKLRTDAHTQGTLTFGMLKQITTVCVRLDTLILQDVCFDAQLIPFGQFPPTLTHLSLKNSDVQNLPVRVSYFNDIHRIMPNIQVLILSHSLWLESHSLMAISKCVKLRELRLQGCYALGDCIAYFSIATRFGFKFLETLDLRGTQVGDPEVSCLNLVPSLRHLYLESITQYARRRDAEYYMNRVRQYPDITVVRNPDAGPVQNPVILLQRIDGEMVARNVTSEFHSFGQPRGDELGRSPPPAHSSSNARPARTPEKWEEPSTSAGTRPTPSAFMRRLRERWQIPDRRLCGATTRSRPVIVVPMKRPRAPGPTAVPNGDSVAGPANPPETYEQYNALEDALRLRGVITLIHDNIFASRAGGATPGPVAGSSGVSSSARTRGEEAGPSSARETIDCEENEGEKENEERNGENGEEQESNRQPREVEVQEGRVVVHISNPDFDGATQSSSDELREYEPPSAVHSDTNDSDFPDDVVDVTRFKRPLKRPDSCPNPSESCPNLSEEEEPVPLDPLLDYREYLTRYIREDSSRGMEEEVDAGRKDGGEEKPQGNNAAPSNKVETFAIDNGPCCSYMNKASAGPLDCSASLPSCSKYDGQGGQPPSSPPPRRDPRKRRLSPNRPRTRGRTFNALESPEGSDIEPNESDSDDPSDPEDRPLSASSPLHFCTIGRARFSGLTVPFFHRVPQVTNSCVHAICSGKTQVRPLLGYNITTLRANPREPVHECRLETLVLRHFPKITDQSLYVLSKLTSLRYLDVTGTSVTACGVKNFRLMRPDVQVTSDHDVLIEP